MPELDEAVVTAMPRPAPLERRPPPFRDESGDIRPEFVEAVSRAIDANDRDGLRDLVGELHESDLGDLIEALDPEHRPRLIELLGAHFDFTALTEIDDAVRQDILDELTPKTVAEGVRELESDDAVYILQHLDRAGQAEILDQLPAVERVALQRSLDYPEDSAGRRMQTEFIAVAPFWTVGQTIDFMRESANLPDTFYEIFVVDPRFTLLGSVPLDRLLRTKRPVPVSDLMHEVRRIRATDPTEEVARLFQRYNLVSAPVLDEAERLVGVMTIDDIVDVIEEEADAEIKALGGVQPDEEISDNVLTIARGRFRWLFVNLLTAFLASSVLKVFETELERMVALAVLAPIVASQGGNAGTQTMTVAVRALATRDLGPWNMARVVGREAMVGVLNGVAFAVITGLLAALWFSNSGLGIVIGLAMVANLLAAALAGIIIPLALDRVGIDPAVSSGSFVTTVTDVVGFFSFLGIATLWFGLA
jgi:magnesium transporter